MMFPLGLSYPSKYSLVYIYIHSVYIYIYTVYIYIIYNLYNYLNMVEN